MDDQTRRIIDLEREGYALRARIKRLQDAGKTVIGQREEWMARALAAEELLETERRPNGDDRFDRLRRMVAKELHPDFCTAGSLEKLMRARNASSDCGRKSNDWQSRDNRPPRQPTRSNRADQSAVMLFRRSDCQQL